MRLLPIVFFAIAAPVAAQDSLESARRAFEEGALDVALERFTDALENPSRDRAELAEIHRYLGVLRVAQGDVESAMREFEYSLALDPNQTAPAELGAAHRARFDQIRGARTGPIELALSASGAVSREASTAVSARLTNAPAGLVASIRIASDSTGWQTELAPSATEFRLPPAAWGARDRVTVTASAVDAHGNVIVAANVELAPAVVAPARETVRPNPHTTVVEEEDDGGTIFESPIFWTIAGAVVVAAGVTVVLFATATTEYQFTPRFEP
jgi:hypothetical protein